MLYCLTPRVIPQRQRSATDLRDDPTRRTRFAQHGYVVGSPAGDIGFFENWQGCHAEATVVPLSAPIADLSEARVNEFSIGCTTEVRSGPAVTLQAHLTGDPLGRDVFVFIETQPVLACDGPDVPDQGFQLGVVETLAQQLVDALLAHSGWMSTACHDRRAKQVPQMVKCLQQSVTCVVVRGMRVGSRGRRERRLWRQHPDRRDAHRP